jgi:hypothetical protein
VFQALPVHFTNESLKAELAETGPDAPVGEVREGKGEEGREEEDGGVGGAGWGSIFAERFGKGQGGEGVEEEVKMEAPTIPEVDLTAVEYIVPEARDTETAAGKEVKSHEKGEA